MSVSARPRQAASDRRREKTKATRGAKRIGVSYLIAQMSQTIDKSTKDRNLQYYLPWSGQ
jgi:hypothetical protein